MPGLLRGVARTAVIAGTASAVNGRVQRRQAERFASRDAHIYAERRQAYANEVAQPPLDAPQPPPPVASPSPDDVYAQLERLGKLRDDGVLTDEEFAAEKAKLLA